MDLHTQTGDLFPLPQSGDLKAWFDTLLASIAALERRSEMAEESHAAHRVAIRELRAQQAATDDANVALRDALATREAEANDLRDLLTETRQDAVAAREAQAVMQATVQNQERVLAAAGLGIDEGAEAPFIDKEALEAALARERGVADARFAERKDVNDVREAVEGIESMITGVERLSGEAQAKLEAMRGEIIEKLRAEEAADRAAREQVRSRRAHGAFTF